MYEIVEALCNQKSVTVAQMCRDIGMRPTVISELKHGRTKNLSHSNMVKIANYFKVSVDVFSNENLISDIDNKNIENKKSSPIDELGDIEIVLYGTVYETIDALCKQRGITHGKMCADLGYSRNTMASLKSGRSTTLKLEKAKKIAEYFDVSIDYLLGNEKSSPIDELEGVDFALFGEVKELTTEEKEDILAYIRFKKSQRK